MVEIGHGTKLIARDKTKLNADRFYEHAKRSDGFISTIELIIVSLCGKHGEVLFEKP